MTSADQTPSPAELVEKDVSDVLGRVLDPGGRGGGFETVRAGALAGAHVIEWTYSGRTTPEFLGLGTNGEAVMICGVTVVEGADAEPQFRRYIDWASVYAELGV